MSPRTDMIQITTSDYLDPKNLNIRNLHQSTLDQQPGFGTGVTYAVRLGIYLIETNFKRTLNATDFCSLTSSIARFILAITFFNEIIRHLSCGYYTAIFF
jgi:hypothetical protein